MTGTINCDGLNPHRYGYASLYTVLWIGHMHDCVVTVYALQCTAVQQYTIHNQYQVYRTGTEHSALQRRAPKHTIRSRLLHLYRTSVYPPNVSSCYVGSCRCIHTWYGICGS